MSNIENNNPMTAEEVLRLKTIKAKSAEKSANLKLSDKEPEMEIIDGRAYPKGMKSVAITMNEKSVDDKVTETDHFYPTHADFEYQPKLEPKKDRKPKFIERENFLTVNGARTIFGPDQRKVFNSTAYPWRCVGRVESPLGIASGVMIGPRHLLTCSHIIDWKPNNQTGWLKFTPMYYNGSAPYGTAWGIQTYYKHKVAGPTIDGTEVQFDYVVVVLDRPIGSSTGWLGSKSYSDSWDGQASFTHAGYPADLTGTQRPTFQTGIALDGDFWSPDDNESINHQADIWPGQSGGPFWGYWNGSPYAVATQSAHNPSINFASGGSDLVGLVTRARNEYP
ncbi:trypsin-like peptidase domain-containing protein [Chryseobacterium wangxinyae]|uniref:trypsin-like serine peptidase n=1 Tax=Chryseobacterium sp. CY350 TaxID=2997336 RepID=UPI00226E187E|nr:trypsin-like peptidase domain-containing protein [Chryseobacterium sp. CY350]MCY0976150.1 trypsin-like peptidase domain-containing protein [Chryseobacterium sp. CY350]WBZ94250.1 trypsin-like peptidase domain-containing protein [Chryseobacterium sp. CY350]